MLDLPPLKRSDLDIISPEYRRPSGFFGVRAGACIRQNTV